MNWQERMVHGARCGSDGFAKRAGLSQSCTCGRDATVSAIEAVIEAVGVYLDNFARESIGLKGCPECEWLPPRHHESCKRGPLQDALDRLDALAEEGGE